MKWSLQSALTAATLFATTSTGFAQGYTVGGSEDRPRPQATQGGQSGQTGQTNQATPAAQGSQSSATVTDASGQTPRITNTANRRERAWWEYAGVTPGGNELAVLRRWARGRRNRPAVAWPGFQMTPQGSRVFLAVTHSPSFTPVNEPGRLVYRLANAVIPLSNNRRVLETGAFSTPVTRAFLRSRGRDAELVIELRASSLPNVSQHDGPEGVTFVMLDFPQWTPPAESTTRTVTASGQVTPANTQNNTPSQPAQPATGVDNERPGQIRVQKYALHTSPVRTR